MTNKSSVLAYQLQQDTEGIRNTLTHDTLQMGHTMLLVKRSKAYELLDHDTFESYIAAHGLSQYSVDRAMRVVKFFCEEHKVPPDDLAEIGIHKLDEVKKAIKLQPELIDEWMIRAREWSPSDLINAVRELQGKPPLEPKQKSRVGDSFLTSFRDWVRGQPCCVCDCPPPSTYAHWPIREKWKKVGGEFGIPLCVACHKEMDEVQGYVTFFDHYRAKIGKHLDKLKKEWEEK